MLSKLKYKLRRLAQLVMGLDADNASFSALNRRLDCLERQLKQIKSEFLFNENLVPRALECFSVPEGFFSKENSFIAQLEDLGLVNQSIKVAELMCCPGLNAKSLSGKVKEYWGFDSSKIGIKLLQSLMPEHKFYTLDELTSETYDLIIVASREGRWSRVAVDNLVLLASRFLAPKGSIVVELPYPDSYTVSSDFKFKVVTLPSEPTWGDLHNSQLEVTNSKSNDSAVSFDTAPLGTTDGILD